MTALAHRSLMLFGAVFLITLSSWIAADSVFPATSSSSASRPATRWAQLDFNQQDSGGDVLVGKAVTLTVTLGGVTQGAHPIVAVYESSLFESQMVTL